MNLTENNVTEDTAAMRKTASTTVPVHPLLAERWSPRAFDRAHEISDEALSALLEAARWAPSAGNSQPWRFLVTRRGEPAHDRLYAALAPGNQAWAGAASIKRAVSGRVAAQPPSVTIPPPTDGSRARPRRRRGGLPRA